MHGEERRIIEALCTNLSAAGFQPVALWTGDSYLMPSNGDAGCGLMEVDSDKVPDSYLRPLTTAEVLQAFEDYDMYAPTLHFSDQHETGWGGRGVMLVPGNRCDLISDWHCGNAAFNAIVESVTDAADGRAFE